MIETIHKFSVKNKLIVCILTFVFVGFGILRHINLPIDAVPDITNNQVQSERGSPLMALKNSEHFITFSVEFYLFGGQNICATELKI